jgi:hypothetical protein
MLPPLKEPKKIVWLIFLMQHPKRGTDGAKWKVFTPKFARSAIKESEDICMRLCAR